MTPTHPFNLTRRAAIACASLSLSSVIYLGVFEAVEINPQWVIIEGLYKDFGVAGGFGGNHDHDPHVLYTLSAVQVLALFDRLDAIDTEKVASCILMTESRMHLDWIFFGSNICMHQVD